MHLAAYILGFIMWTLIEYLLHRFLGHVPRGKGSFSKEHLKHHSRLLYFERWHQKVVLAIVVFSLLLAIFYFGTTSLLGAFLGAAGFVSGWFVYELTHQAIHEEAPQKQYTRFMWRHHLYHHCVNPWVNFGVTSPLWDLIFQTYASSKKVRVPPRHRGAIPWLKEDDGWQERVFERL